jgi:tetratricopeptide (TPR) repeat protein
MKNYVLLLLGLFLYALTASAHAQGVLDTAHDPMLVIVLMVKDEAPVIRETLQPFMDPEYLDKLGFFIFDTGSTDDTMVLAQNLFNDYNVENAVIAQEPFVDFATSRNRALRLAEEAFPDGCFMLMLDAEWYLHNLGDLVAFCDANQHTEGNLYLLRIMNRSLDFFTARLIRCGTDTHFIGVVHEVLNEITYAQVPYAFFELRTTKYGNEKSYNRFFRDRDLLLVEYDKNCYDPRTIFYLAQTSICLGDLEGACLWFHRYIELPFSTWDEERFMVHYRYARALEDLGRWDQAEGHYLKAIAQRPHRAEPLMRLAYHYWNAGNNELCFMFARRAAELPYPEHDLLFIEKELYLFDRYDLLSQVAWYVHEYELGENALRKAIAVHPRYDYLYDNLACYLRPVYCSNS